MTKFTRAVTWSEFDHVAVILKFAADPDEVYILEATNLGVSLTKWSKIRDSIGPD